MRILPTLILMGTLSGGGLFPQEPAGEQVKAQNSGQGFSRLTALPRITLEELRQDPDAYLGLRVRLEIFLRGEQVAVQPYFTRFSPTRYVRFGAQGTAEPLWDQAEENLFGYVFVSKNAAALGRLSRAQKNQVVELTVIVRDTLWNVPWLEVVGVASERKWVPDGSLIAVARGRRMEKEGQRELALRSFQKALVEPLPDFMKVDLYLKIASLHREAEKPREAEEVLRRALLLDPGNPAIQAELGTKNQ